MGIVESNLDYEQTLSAWGEEKRDEGFAEGKEKGFAEGKEKGFAEGKEEGREEGREKQAVETVKKMLSRGYDHGCISEMTGLSLQRVAALALEESNS